MRSNDDLARARAESAGLLRLDPENLSPADALKCDLVSTLRSVIDDEQAKSHASNGADLGKLIVAVDALTKLLPASPVPVPPLLDYDPKEKLKQIVENMRAAQEAERLERGLPADPMEAEVEMLRARVAELEAMVERLTAGPRLLSAPEDKPIDGEIIEPEPEAKPKPEAPRQARTHEETMANMHRVNSDRTIDHKIMTAPSVFKGEPQPSTGREPWRPFVGRFL
jgi:hypothetical protein